MSANFTPTKDSINAQGAFRFWCQKTLPLVYDDSLSYYELLCKVVKYLNDMNESVNTIGENTRLLYQAYISLQDYVNNYFDNLDVQDEINKKLDEYVADGTFDLIVDRLVKASPVLSAKTIGILPENSGELNSTLIKQYMKSGITIYFPAGTYRFRDNIVMFSNTSIIGEGASSILLRSNYVPDTLINKRGPAVISIDGSNVSLKNITLKCEIDDTQDYTNEYIDGDKIGVADIRIMGECILSEGELSGSCPLFTPLNNIIIENVIGYNKLGIVIATDYKTDITINNYKNERGTIYLAEKYPTNYQYNILLNNINVAWLYSTIITDNFNIIIDNSIIQYIDISFTNTKISNSVITMFDSQYNSEELKLINTQDFLIPVSLCGGEIVNTTIKGVTGETPYLFNAYSNGFVTDKASINLTNCELSYANNLFTYDVSIDTQGTPISRGIVFYINSSIVGVPNINKDYMRLSVPDYIRFFTIDGVNRNEIRQIGQNAFSVNLLLLANLIRQETTKLKVGKLGWFDNIYNTSILITHQFTGSFPCDIIFAKENELITRHGMCYVDSNNDVYVEAYASGQPIFPDYDNNWGIFIRAQGIITR